MRILLNQVIKSSGSDLEAKVLYTLIKSWASNVWKSENEMFDLTQQ